MGGGTSRLPSFDMPTAVSIDITPISAIAELVKAAGAIAGAVMEYSLKYRESMSEAQRIRYDEITIQALERWNNWAKRIDAFFGGL